MVGTEVCYFTLEMGQELGPVSFRELYERAVREDDERLQVRREGEPAFRSISLLPEFRHHFERHSQGRIRTAPDCPVAKDKTGA
jgi:hypothetical protein